MVEAQVSPVKNGKRPLQNIRVLDLTQSPDGNFCTLMLALYGADVIKVEPPKAQEPRSRYSKTPPLDSIFFIQLNHDKRGITLDLSNAKGVAIFKGMVKKVDVVVEDLPPGTMEKYGVSYDTLKEINPKLIYGCTRGFRSDSPYKDFPKHDALAQAVSGVMTTNGLPGNPPCRNGSAIADWATGVFSAIGILAAILKRNTTGVGRMVETSMQEATIALTIDWMQMYLQSGNVPGRRGNSPYRRRDDLEMPKGIYQCSNGHILVSTQSEKAWENLLRIVGRTDLIGDPRFADQIKRAEHREIVDEVIESWTKSRTKEEVMTTMGPQDIIVGMLRNLKEVLENPYLNEIGLFKEVNHPRRGKIKVFGLPVKVTDFPTEPEKSSPLLGEDNEAVYGELLGYSKAEVAALGKKGVI